METNGRIEVIPYDECVELLAGATAVGRLAVVSDGEPFVAPVNYVWDGSGVVMRTDPGRKLAGAVGRIVVFEIDRIDAAAEQGWSVLVRGRAEPVDPTGGGVPELRTWAPGVRAHWLRVPAETVSGRRLRRDHELADEWWRLAASS